MTAKIIRADGTTEITNIKSCVYTESVNAQHDLRPGSANSAMLNVTVFGAESSAPNVGEALTYYQVQDGVETLIGTFYAEPSVSTKATYSFTAYDAVAKLDADYSARLTEIQDDFPMSIYALVADACSVAGVTLGSASWPLSTQTVQAFNASNITCRQIVQWAAEIACRFVRCNTAGALVFDWYDTVTDTIAPTTGTHAIAYKQDGLQYEDYDIKTVTSVAVRPLDTEGAAYIYPSSVVNDDNPFVISGNLLTTNANGTFMNAIAQNVYSVMSSLPAWRPATVKLFPFENPFRAGNIVSVTDIQGVTFNTLVMQMQLSQDAAVLSSTGSETYADYEESVKTALANLSASIVQINRLKVGWADIQEAIVEYLKLYGTMTVYTDSGLATIGGKLGYTTGNLDLPMAIGMIIASALLRGVTIVSDSGAYLAYKGDSDFLYYLDGSGRIDIEHMNYGRKVGLTSDGLFLRGGDRWEASQVPQGETLPGSANIPKGDVDIMPGGDGEIVVAGYTLASSHQTITETGDPIEPYTFSEELARNWAYPSELGNLSSLSTAAKSSLVAAVNEVAGKTLKTIGGALLGNTTGGTSGTTFTLSSSGVWLILTAHNAGTSTVGAWIVSTNGGYATNLAGGTTITLQVTGTSLKVTTGGANVSVYGIKLS